MANKKIHFKSEELKDRNGVAAFLRELADKIENNDVLLRRGMKEVRLNVPDTLALGLESEQRKKKGKTKHSFEIEMEWIEGEHSDNAVVLA